MLDFRQLLFVFGASAAFCLLTSCQNGASNATTGPAFPLEGYETEELGQGVTLAFKQDADGNFTEYGTLLNGVKNGTWITFGTRSKPKKVETWVNGVLYGMTLELNDSGQFTSYYAYKNNQLHGPFRQDNYTFPIKQAGYRDGELDGVLKEYYENTQNIRQESPFKAGKLHGTVKYYDQKGKLVFEQDYENGEKVTQ